MSFATHRSSFRQEIFKVCIKPDSSYEYDPTNGLYSNGDIVFPLYWDEEFDDYLGTEEREK